CRLLPLAARDAGNSPAFLTLPVGSCNASRPLPALVRLERGEPAVAPAHARRDPIGIERLPLRQDAREGLALVDRGIGAAQPAEACAIAPAVIGDAARRVQLDRLERPHERPAQAEPVLERLVEILRRHIALAGEAECLRQQRRLQAVEDEALDLAL